MKIQSEKGQVLVLAMIAIMVGALVIPPFLGHVGTSLIGSRNYGDLLDVQYAADAGAEHAVWNLVYGNVLESIPDPGDFTTYTLNETINGENVTVVISNYYYVVAWDNFESGGFTGGGGWLDDWTVGSGTPEISTTDEHWGEYHLLLEYSDEIHRSVDLSDQTNVQLRFWYQQYLGGFDHVYLRISNDGENWENLYDFYGDYMTSYNFFTVPIDPSYLADPFYLSFQCVGLDYNDYFYVDDLDIVMVPVEMIAFAEDDFDHGLFPSGGGGWNGDWSDVNGVEVLDPPWPQPDAHSSPYCARMYDGDMTRSADLSGETITYLQFWVNTYGFDLDDDWGTCSIRPDGTGGWTTVYTCAWTGEGRGDADGVWHEINIPLTDYEPGENFQVRFQSSSDSDEYFYVDDIKIFAASGYSITVYAGDLVLKTTLDLTGDKQDIYDWYYE